MLRIVLAFLRIQFAVLSINSNFLDMQITLLNPKEMTKLSEVPEVTWQIKHSI